MEVTSLIKYQIPVSYWVGVDGGDTFLRSVYLLFHLVLISEGRP